MEFIFPMEALREGLKSLRSRIAVGRRQESMLQQQLKNVLNLTILFQQYLIKICQGYVYWIEIVKRKRITNYVLRGVPIHVAEELHTQVFDKLDRMIMTSATLTTSKNFEFIKERLGYHPTEELLLDAPFDYPSQSIIICPSRSS